MEAIRTVIREKKQRISPSQGIYLLSISLILSFLTSAGIYPESSTMPVEGWIPACAGMTGCKKSISLGVRMTAETVVSLFSEGVYLMILMLIVLITPGLIVGLLVAIFQAATQINEMSLSFIPKLFITFLVMVFAGPWLLKTMINYTDNLITNIPYLIG